MKTKKEKPFVTKFRQGRGWVVSHWDERLQGFVHSHEMPYWQACDAVKRMKLSIQEEIDTKERMSA